jgi:hypothetical protein
MPRVVVDGVVYVPEVRLQGVEVSGADQALRELLSAVVLYGPGHGRDLWNVVWDALRALRPGIDSMDEQEVRHLYYRLMEEG